MNDNEHENLDNREKENFKDTSPLKGKLSNESLIINSKIQIFKEESLTFQKKAMKKLIIASIICLVFMIVEIFGGIISGSIAIISDAAHMLSDFSGFTISLISILISKKPPSSRLSYGYYRAEVIGAMLSTLLIWALTAWLIMEGVEKVRKNEKVDNPLMMLIIACIGLVCNVFIGTALHTDIRQHHNHLNLHNQLNSDTNEETKEKEKNEEKVDEVYKDTESSKGLIPENQRSLIESEGSEKQDSDLIEPIWEEKKEDQKKNDCDEHEEPKSEGFEGSHKRLELKNMNIRAAFIHVFGDVIQSIGVIIAAVIVIVSPNWHIADPICTFLFSIIVIFTTIPILKDCIRIFMEGTPYEIDLHEILSVIQEVQGVEEVHDLHIWTLNSQNISLSCHLVTKTPMPTLKKVTRLLNIQYKILHTTIQVESPIDSPFICQTSH